MLTNLRNTLLFRSMSFILMLVFCACGGISDATAQTSRTNETQKTIRIALLLDTSNSMDGLIEQAKSQLWKIVNELSKAQVDNTKPDIQIALYEYGNDRLTPAEGYIRMVTPLTNDLDKISSDLFGLTTNGGSEFCGTVINTSLKQLNWNQLGQDLQLIFIAGNEPFDQGSFSYKEACSGAKNKQVVVNTIYCGNYEQGIREWWYDGAKLTGGSYMNIDQNKQTVFIETPYDDQIANLNSKLNDTYIYYGSQGEQKKMNQVTQDANSANYGKANSVERTITKSKHVYKNDSWDLVDAAKKTEFKYSTVQRSSLPKEIQTYTDDQLRTYIDAKAKERTEITKQIEELSKKREAYLVEKRKETTGAEITLDQAMLNAIREQAKAKGMMFN